MVKLLLTGSWCIEHIPSWLYGETSCFVAKQIEGKGLMFMNQKGNKVMFLLLLQKACHYCVWNNRKWMLINCQCWGGAPVVGKSWTNFLNHFSTFQVLYVEVVRVTQHTRHPNLQKLGILTLCPSWQCLEVVFQRKDPRLSEGWMVGGVKTWLHLSSECLWLVKNHTPWKE